MAEQGLQAATLRARHRLVAGERVPQVMQFEIGDAPFVSMNSETAGRGLIEEQS